MPNSYFKFKQFTVHQDKCAMKVCTDACLFGSLLSAFHNAKEVEHVLDIGTGTGLLSLMYAQKNAAAIIDAVEVDASAAQQAKENFEASPWKERLHVYHTPIQEFGKTVLPKYDMIISNPPFYESDLKSDDCKRNLALHSAALTLDELIALADMLLATDGIFCVLLPYYRTEAFEKLTAGRFFLKEEIRIKQTPAHNYFRSVLCLTKQATATVKWEITIKEENAYTAEFAARLQAYYLYL